jgi:hypothetical protein
MTYVQVHLRLTSLLAKPANRISRTHRLSEQATGDFRVLERFGTLAECH